MAYENIKFVYNEPAMIVKAESREHLVIADLHIGMELGLSKKGVHLFGASERMAGRINAIMNQFSLRSIIMLGDIKESILYPEEAETRLLKQFFSSLEKFEIRIVAGNHDAHLSEIIGRSVEKELVIGNFGFVHGNRKPDDGFMLLDYIVSAHEHLAVRIKEKNGAAYDYKAWAVYGVNKSAARAEYKKFNERIKLVSMPAFNELIHGRAIEKGKGGMNPMLTNNIFSSRKAEVYSLLGQRIDLG
ncbi:MAG: hypothetical protein ABSE71_00015 [Candidatus Micrarchaeaceae archaeon]